MLPLQTPQIVRIATRVSLVAALSVGIGGCHKKATPSLHTDVGQSTQTGSPSGAVNHPPERVIRARKKTESRWAAYANGGYGVSFRYPRIYAVKDEQLDGSDAHEAAIPPDAYEGQVLLARVEISADMYPQTDFEFAEFRVSANRYVTDNECREMVSPEENSKPVTKTVQGIVFSGSRHAIASADVETEWESYATYSNETCYQIDLVLTASPEGFQRKADLQKIWKRLDAIFRTVKIGPVKLEETVDEETAITAFTAAPFAINDVPNAYRISWDTRGASAKQIFLAARCSPEIAIFQINAEGSERASFPCGVLNSLDRLTGSITLEIENESDSTNLQELRLFAGGVHAVTGATAFAVPPLPAAEEHEGNTEDSRNGSILYADMAGVVQKPAI